jgi:hypothetical protein
MNYSNLLDYYFLRLSNIVSADRVLDYFVFINNLHMLNAEFVIFAFFRLLEFDPEFRLEPEREVLKVGDSP